MVGIAEKSRFWEEEDGLSMVEGLIVFPLILLMFAAFFEFGFAVHQWNQTVKALQLGARLAAVSDPLVTDTDELTSDYSGIAVAQPVPATIKSVSCGADTGTACSTDDLNRLVYGSDDKCDVDIGTSLPGMCDFNDRIRPEHIAITYYRAGLGYVGHIGGPVVTVSVQLKNLTFHLPLVGALLGLGDLTVPAHAVTVTGEDLASCTTDSCT